MLPTSTDVLVVGAGPTGLTAALGLVTRGHPVTVVDAQAEGDNTSRACVVHAHTLESLAPLGVTDRLVEQGLEVPRFTIRDRNRLLVDVPFGDLPTEHPYTLMIPQQVTEATLLARFTELGGRVLRPYRVGGLVQDGDGVTVSFDGGERVRARYVVGADGMHSVVRDQVGIGFPDGHDATTLSFALADVRVSDGTPTDEVILYFSVNGMLVVAPLPGGTYRLVAEVEHAPEHPDVAFAQHLLDTRGPKSPRVVVREVAWGSRFRIHHRVAERYLSGRVVLAGDSAHVHSPAGGQGMNAGITDATRLAEALSGILDGGSPDLLDAYAAARRPVARNVVALAGRLTRLANAPAGVRRPRNLVLGAVGRLPAVRRRLAMNLSGLVYR